MSRGNTYLVAQPNSVRVEYSSELQNFLAALKIRGAKVHGASVIFGIIVSYDEEVGTAEVPLPNAPKGWHYGETFSLSDALEELSTGQMVGMIE